MSNKMVVGLVRNLELENSQCLLKIYAKSLGSYNHQDGVKKNIPKISTIFTVDAYVF